MTARFEQLRVGGSFNFLWRFQPLLCILPSPPMLLSERVINLDVVERLFTDGVHLLTISGAPGVGKTRLSLDVAARMQFDFEDGATLLDLAPVANKVSCICLLYGRTLAMKVLVTSQSALRVRSEHIHVLAPLEEAEVVQLFPNWACEARPGCALTKEFVETITRLCQHLDNLPLRIELVAVRVRMFSPAKLLLQLDARLKAAVARDRHRAGCQSGWGARFTRTPEHAMECHCLEL